METYIEAALHTLLSQSPPSRVILSPNIIHKLYLKGCRADILCITFCVDTLWTSMYSEEEVSSPDQAYPVLGILRKMLPFFDDIRKLESGLQGVGRTIHVTHSWQLFFWKQPPEDIMQQWLSKFCKDISLLLRTYNHCMYQRYDFLVRQ